MQNFRLSTSQMKFHQLCTLISSFCWKYIKFQRKGMQELCFMILKSGAKFEEKLIFCFKNAKNLINLQFDWSFLSKVHNVKKVQRSYVSWHWRVMQGLKKNSLVVWKMTWRIWKIFIRTLESVKIGTFLGSFCPK